MMQQRKQPSRYFIFILSAWLTGCAGSGQTTSGGAGRVVGGIILALLALGLFFLIRYAEQRWQILRMLRLTSWFRRIPIIGPYLIQGLRIQNEARRAETQVQRVQKGVAQLGKSKPKPLPPLRWGTLREGIQARWAQWRGQDDEPFEKSPTLDVEPHIPVPTDDVARPVLALGQVSPTVARRYVEEETFDLHVDAEVDLIGRKIGRYQIDALLHSGTTSQTYQAYDLKLQRAVIVKVAHGGLATNSEIRARLIQILQTAGALNHPHIVDLFDYDTFEGHLFWVTEYAGGLSLDQYVTHLRERGEPFSLGQMLTLLAEVAAGLHNAHRHGLVHEGLKPSHILLIADADGGMAAKVTDFGLAGLRETVSADLYPYAPPERWQQQPTDARSDLYMLGALLYELVTGRPVFGIDSAETAHYKHTTEQPTPPSRLRPSLDLAVEQVILTALAKEPADRFQSADEMAQALRRVAALVGDGEGVRPIYAGESILHIDAAGEERRTILLDRPTLFIGSARDNDIVLTGRGVGEHHARLEQTTAGWNIIDLHSPTGTYLEGATLLPDLVEFWSMESAVVIGPYFLNWQEAEDERDGPTVADPDAQPIGITLLPAQVTIEPGRMADMQMTLVNHAMHVDHFHVEISGLPPEWVRISNNDMQLLPGAQAIVLLNIAPPRNSTAHEGVYPCELRVTPAAYPDLGAVVDAEVEILGFEELLLDLHPERVRNSARCQLSVTNRGNRRAAGTISPRDPADGLRFPRWPQTYSIPAGATDTLELPVAVRDRRWIGGWDTYPFEVIFQSETEQLTQQKGQVEATPRIPAWMLSLLGLLLALLVAGGMFLANAADRRRQTDAIAAALVQPTPRPTTPELRPTPTATPIPPPVDCIDVRNRNRGSVDGEYTVVVGGRPITVFCTNMEEGNPATYFTLENTNAESNFSIYILPDSRITARYSKVRFNPRTLEIDRTDSRFAEIEVVELEGESADSPNDTTPDLGVPIGCNIEGQPPQIARANINLAGTPFVIASDTAFVVQGPDAVGQAIISPSRQQVDLEISGFCGWIWPARQLQLQIVANE